MEQLYVIVNLSNGHMYVGSAITGRMGNRFHKHQYGGSGNKNVWAVLSQIGLENFAFVVVDTLLIIITHENNDSLLALEDRYISLLRPSYNVAPHAGNTFGILHTEETKEAIRLNYSSERRERIGSLNRGKKLKLSTIELIREAAFNRAPMSDETRAKVSSNSAKAQLYEVSKVDGSSFSSSSGSKVTSLVLRTLPAVASFIKCDVRTIARAKNGIVKKVWKVTNLGKAKST